jgi:hypothetical protein
VIWDFKEIKNLTQSSNLITLNEGNTPELKFNNGKTEQKTIKIEANYFTNLFPIGSWKFRQFIKPVLVFFTLPFTIFTLGLFLLVINALMILLCTEIVGGFRVDSFWTALLFSVILSLSQSLINGLLKDR